MRSILNGVATSANFPNHVVKEFLKVTLTALAIKGLPYQNFQITLAKKQS